MNHPAFHWPMCGLQREADTGGIRELVDFGGTALGVVVHVAIDRDGLTEVEAAQVVHTVLVERHTVQLDLGTDQIMHRADHGFSGTAGGRLGNRLDNGSFQIGAGLAGFGSGLGGGLGLVFGGGGVLGLAGHDDVSFVILDDLKDRIVVSVWIY